jgi:hypothetical protein
MQRRGEELDPEEHGVVLQSVHENAHPIEGFGMRQHSGDVHEDDPG